MSNIKIIISGQTPAKKNSNKISCKGKFPQIYKTSIFEVWHENAMIELHEQKISKEKAKSVSVFMTFFVKDNRVRDVTNMAESIMDLLVDFGVLADDRWQFVNYLHFSPVEIDRKNPRAEIEIT